MMGGIVLPEMEFQTSGSYPARTDQEMRKKRRVLPAIVPDYDRRSDFMELNRTNHVSKRRSSSRSIHQWQKVSNEVHAVSKWKNYTSSMRERKGYLTKSKGPGPTYGGSKGFDRQNSACVLDSDVEDIGLERLALYDTGGYMKPLPPVRNGEGIHPVITSSRTLIIYFAELAKASLEVPQELDFEFIEGLLEEGADLNFTDRHGQTIMHEVARIWHVDVAKFILENGGDVNKADDYGRTPLHVAAAVDYPEMVEFLVSSEADLNARTKIEYQTPTHYAAKNDAARALKVLLKLGGGMEDFDYKQRTPLQVAAELDRSETAKYLIDQGGPAGVQDVSGCSVMSLMISKMPPVAKEALDQFHTTDRANRRQYFYLNHLEPYHLPDIHGQTISCARSPLHCVVLFNQMELIMHPVFQRLIEMKWNQFGRRGTYKNVFIHMLFALVWSALGVTLHFRSDQTNDYYQPPSAYWWRIVLEVVACAMTFYFVFLEFLEIRASKNEHQKWQNWRICELERDVKFCHPRWPEERKYIEAEIADIRNSGISYFNDSWNYFDWVTYGWIVGVVVTRVFAVLLQNDTARSLHPRVFALALIFIWLRLMKVFRPFGNLGPFIVMIGHIIDDTLKFGFLYFIVYIPYVCAFWIVFGGPKNAEIMESAGQDSKGWRNLNDLMYSVWQLTVVGNYPWDSLLVVDRIMAQILCGTYLAVSAIVMLNLFIALMSDTFQRVYDNAKANAAMQRASAILNMEENMREKQRESHRRLVHEKLAPEELYYDDDSTQPGSGILERMTNQIKEVVDEVLEVLTTKNGGGTGSRKHHDIDSLRSELMKVSSKHEQAVKKMSREVAEMKELLVRVLQNGAQPLLPSVTSSQPLLAEETAKKETPSKRYSSGQRSHPSKHQRLHSLQSDNDDDHVSYQGLPLPQNIPCSSELPGITVLASRGSSRHQARNNTNN